MKIYRQPDVEDAVRQVLDDYVQTYCRPLPATYTLPNLLVQQTGGGESDLIDTATIAVDCRAETEAQAQETLRNAVGILQEQEKAQTSAIRRVIVLSLMSWGADPMRPDLALCSVNLQITVHPELTEIQRRQKS